LSSSTALVIVQLVSPSDHLLNGTSIFNHLYRHYDLVLKCLIKSTNERSTSGYCLVMDFLHTSLHKFLRDHHRKKDIQLKEFTKLAFDIASVGYIPLYGI